jgi:hypothetical protein
MRDWASLAGRTLFPVSSSRPRVTETVNTCLDCDWRVRETDLGAIDSDRAMIDHAIATGHAMRAVER